MFYEQTDIDGNPRIQSETIRGFQLSCGSILPEVRIGFCVFGQNPNNPLVVLHPALTGSPRAVIQSGRPSQGDGWWQHCVGPNKLLDTKQFTVLCFDNLGGNGATSSARELSAYRDQLHVRDGVNLIASFLQSRGISSVHAVVGGSFGGGQALEWLFQDKIAIEKIFDICGSYCANGLVGEFFSIQAELLTEQGDNIGQLLSRLKNNSRDLLGQAPAFDLVFETLCAQLEQLRESYDRRQALVIARQIGLLRFVTPKYFQAKYEHYQEKFGSADQAAQQLRAWFERQGETFPERFDADALAQLCRLDSRAKQRPAREIARALIEHHTRLVGFAVNGDVLFDPAIQRGFYEDVKRKLPEGQKGLVDLITVTDEVNGHDHFLSEAFLQNVPRLQFELN